MTEYQDIVGRLSKHKGTSHYLIHYNLRNPDPGLGMGNHGIYGQELIEIYAEALERLYTCMTTEFHRPPPPARIPVYVFDTSESDVGDAHAFPGRNGTPSIALPSRSFEPTLEACKVLAQAQAIHEATHIFNWSRVQHDIISCTTWGWFDEATAVLMENYVLQDNFDYLRYAPYWTDHPDVPLNRSDPKAIYRAGFFLRYLAHRSDIGEQLVNAVWLQSEVREDPLTALIRLLRDKDIAFSSIDPAVSDVFASGYCMASYFAQVQNSFAHGAYMRCGERAMTEVFHLEQGKSFVRNESLDHLACHYYRFKLPADAAAINVEVHPTGIREPCLKAELAFVYHDGHCMEVAPATHCDVAGMKCLTIHRDMPKAAARYALLVISNCSTTHDKQQYSVHASGS